MLESLSSLQKHSEGPSQKQFHQPLIVCKGQEMQTCGTCPQEPGAVSYRVLPPEPSLVGAVKNAHQHWAPELV